MTECKALARGPPRAGAVQGGAVKVDPIKPKLKAPGTKRLKLKCDEQLSNVAFNFNVRRYNKVEARRTQVVIKQVSNKWRLALKRLQHNVVGRCRLKTMSKPVFKVPMAWSQRLNLQYDETLSNFAAKLNVCRYNKEEEEAGRTREEEARLHGEEEEVNRLLLLAGEEVGRLTGEEEVSCRAREVMEQAYQRQLQTARQARGFAHEAAEAAVAAVAAAAAEEAAADEEALEFVVEVTSVETRACNLQRATARGEVISLDSDTGSSSGGYISLGKAVNVEPMKPTLKAPGTKRLKLSYCELLSIFASEVILRRYRLAAAPALVVGRCKLKLVLRAPGACNNRLKSKHDELLPSFAISFNLRRYAPATALVTSMRRTTKYGDAG